ncbi:MAG: hypothetical protein IIB44_13635, partial [Candidatus Marinimicrobia bacterium]|nr:hypothetical protein [Candidatus Neomarinimicrobiota bacterium]
AGVMFRDPRRVVIRGKVTAGYDVCIDVDVILSGNITLGNQVTIGPFSYLHNVQLEDDVTVLSHCSLENAVLGCNTSVGPYSRLRDNVQLGAACKVGNFVELKKTVLGEGSKANHLTYLGDALIGKDVNIGCGVITCNYDGGLRYNGKAIRADLWHDIPQLHDIYSL